MIFFLVIFGLCFFYVFFMISGYFFVIFECFLCFFLCFFFGGAYVFQMYKFYFKFMKIL